MTNANTARFGTIIPPLQPAALATHVLRADTIAMHSANLHPVAHLQQEAAWL